MTNSQKWSSSTVVRVSSKDAVSSFSHPAVVDLHKASAPAQVGTSTWPHNGKKNVLLKARFGVSAGAQPKSILCKAGVNDTGFGTKWLQMHYLSPLALQ